MEKESSSIDTKIRTHFSFELKRNDLKICHSFTYHFSDQCQKNAVTVNVDVGRCNTFRKIENILRHFQCDSSQSNAIDGSFSILTMRSNACVY